MKNLSTSLVEFKMGFCLRRLGLLIQPMNFKLLEHIIWKKFVFSLVMFYEITISFIACVLVSPNNLNSISIHPSCFPYEIIYSTLFLQMLAQKKADTLLWRPPHTIFISWSYTDLFPFRMLMFLAQKDACEKDTKVSKIIVMLHRRNPRLNRQG